MIFLVLLALIIFIIYPAIQEIININQEIKQERSALERKIALGLNIKKITRDFEEIKKSIDQLDKIFIVKNHELEFITELENLATARAVTLEINQDFNGQEMGDNTKQAALELKITGNYVNLINFLQALENRPYYYNIDHFNFLANAKNHQQLTLQISGKIYLKQLWKTKLKK